uniref:Uncharacterized protein n=1 Tax=Triticum urartu TaxID=4572 RepID=A0A8R7PVJ4_TRIUA
MFGEIPCASMSARTSWILPNSPEFFTAPSRQLYTNWLRLLPSPLPLRCSTTAKAASRRFSLPSPRITEVYTWRGRCSSPPPRKSSTESFTSSAVFASRSAAETATTSTAPPLLLPPPPPPTAADSAANPRGRRGDAEAGR